MNSRNLMKQIISNPEFVREKLLNESQIRLFIRIKALGEMTTAHLHITEHISIQHASGKLKALFNKGYLKRIETIAESGGIEHIYRPAF